MDNMLFKWSLKSVLYSLNVAECNVSVQEYCIHAEVCEGRG